MTDEMTTRVNEELHALRHGVDALQRGQEALCADIADVKLSLEQPNDTPAFALSQIAYLQSQVASQTSRIDRFQAHFDRIERHLDLAHA